MQENYALDVHFGSGAMAGRQQLVLRTDAPSAVAASRSRADEFAVLKVAGRHAAPLRSAAPT